MAEVLDSLRFMHNMERFATQIYHKQFRAFRGLEIADRLVAAANNEQEHQDILRKRIIELKGTPSMIGFLFHIAGAVLGFCVTLFGKRFILKTDIWIERKAVSDYGKFLRNVNFDNESVELINRIINDEKKHIETWENAIRTLKSEQPSYG